MLSVLKNKQYEVGFVDGKASAYNYVLLDLQDRIKLELAQKYSTKLINKNQKLLTEVYQKLLINFHKNYYTKYANIKSFKDIKDESFEYKEGFYDGSDSLLLEIAAELKAEYCRRKQLNRILLQYIIEDYNDRYLHL